jgi:putative transposase
VSVSNQKLIKKHLEDTTTIVPEVKMTFKPPAFSLEDDPLDWLSLFEDAVELNSWKEKAALYSVVECLTNEEVRRWFLSKKFTKYLLDKPFTLYTDNLALAYLFAKLEPSQKLQRWVMSLQEFSFNVIHVKSKLNPVADALSRYPGDNTVEEDERLGEDELEDLYEHFLMEFGNEKKKLPDDAYEKELQDLFWLLCNTAELMLQPTNLKIKAIEDNHLFRKVGSRHLLVPYVKERKAILEQVHDGHGHYGQNASWARLYQCYWWPGAYNDMKSYVQSCVSCQLFADRDKSKVHKNPTLMLRLFEQFSIDYVGPLPKSERGNQYILVAVEHFTRWPLALACPDATGITTARFIYTQIFCQFGPPTHLLSDNGSHFEAHVIRPLLHMIQTNHKFANPYHPQTNGMCEKLNGTLVGTIKKLTVENTTNWDLFLPGVLYAYRTKAHGTLNISPFELLYGQPPTMPRRDILQSIGQILSFERMYKLQDRSANMELLYQEPVFEENLEIKKFQKE